MADLPMLKKKVAVSCAKRNLASGIDVIETEDAVTGDYEDEENGMVNGASNILSPYASKLKII